MSPRTATVFSTNLDYQIRIIGDRPRPLRDFYHALLRLSWTATLATIAAGFLVVNAAFAFGFLAIGGVANAMPGSFWDALFFSVQTISTVGYGAMYPVTPAAHALVVVECVVGLTLTALATGLVFAKFSRPTARVVFTRQAVIGPMNGVPTLMLRLGNERGNRIVDARIRLTLSRTEQTAEGTTFYRVLDLGLARDRVLSLARSWTVLHPIDERSPLYGETPESLRAVDAELEVLVVGLDETSMQTVHARYQYSARQIQWGARHADILSEASDGSLVLDVRKFHELEPTVPSETFPYPA